MDGVWVLVCGGCTRFMLMGYLMLYCMLGLEGAPWVSYRKQSVTIGGGVSAE